MLDFIRKGIRTQKPLYGNNGKTHGGEGFTLIELLVVVIILVALTAVAVPIFLRQVEKARIAKAKTEVSVAASALQKCRSIGGTLTFSTDDENNPENIICTMPMTGGASENFQFSNPATTYFQINEQPPTNGMEITATDSFCIGVEDPNAVGSDTYYLQTDRDSRPSDTPMSSASCPGGADPSSGAITVTAESGHNKMIPVKWPRVENPSITGYIVTCDASGQPTRTANYVGNADATLGVVITNVENGVEYDCEVTSLPSDAATPGSDTATPGIYCLPSTDPIPAGWDGVVDASCVENPPDCVDDCPSSNPPYSTATVLRVQTLVDRLDTTGGDQVVDIANDPNRNRLLASTASAKVYAINPNTGNTTLIHDRYPSGTDDWCPGAGNTSCGTYQQIAVVEDTAYLLFNSYKGAACGLGRCPEFSDLLALDLSAPTDGLLDMMCTGGGHRQVGAVGGLPWTPGGTWVNWGASATAMIADDTNVYLALTSGQIVTVPVSTLSPLPAHPTSYSAQTGEAPLRLDRDLYPTSGSIIKACDQYPGLSTTESNIVGLTAYTDDVYALAFTGNIYRIPKATGGNPAASVWGTVTIREPSSWSSPTVDNTLFNTRQAFVATSSWLYMGDGVDVLRVSTADPTYMQRMAGALPRSTNTYGWDGAGVAATFPNTLGMVLLGETIVMTDGYNIRYTTPVTIEPVNWPDTTVDIPNSPTTRAISTSIAISNTDSRYTSMAISPDGDTAWVSANNGIKAVDLETGDTTDTSCVPSSGRISEIRYAGPDALWFTTSANPSLLQVCNLQYGVNSSTLNLQGFSTGNGVTLSNWFETSADGQTLYYTKNTSASINRMYRNVPQIWLSETTGQWYGMGTWTSAVGAGTLRTLIRTSTGVIRYDYTTGGAHMMANFPFGGTPGADTPTLSTGTSGSGLLVAAAAGENMFTAASGGNLKQWPLASPPVNPTGGTTKYTTSNGRNIISIVPANGNIYLLTLPTSGNATIYEVEGS